MTAEHAQPDQKHDAAFKLNKFKVCLREMQNFDGQHNKTRLVSNATVDPARVIK